MNASPAAALVVRVDSLMARTLELEGLLGFYCPLLEDPLLARDRSRRGISYRELAPVLNHPRGGILAAVRDGRAVAYAVFGPPAAFRRAAELPFELDRDALLLATLYAAPEARAESLDVDLLLAVLEFARGQGFAQVQALCREDPEAGPEARTAVIAAAGFEVAEPPPGRLPAPVRGLSIGSLEIRDRTNDPD